MSTAKLQNLNVAVALEQKLDNPPPDALGCHNCVYIVDSTTRFKTLIFHKRLSNDRLK